LKASRRASARLNAEAASITSGSIFKSVDLSFAAVRLFDASSTAFFTSSNVKSGESCSAPSAKTINRSLCISANPPSKIIGAQPFSVFLSKNASF
jgi:hypothetical protein